MCTDVKPENDQQEANAKYAVSGVRGTFGRAIAELMVERGAKHQEIASQHRLGHHTTQFSYLCELASSIMGGDDLHVHLSWRNGGRL
jgi:hypothetical protein